MYRICLLLCLTFNACALEVIPLATVQDTSSMQLDLSSPIGVPAYSKATVGKIVSTKVGRHILDSNIFVMGADSYSQKWLFNNQTKLRESNSIGYITNVKDYALIIQLQEQTQLPLLPVNVDPLMQLLKIDHYPFALTREVVWQ